MVQMKTFVIHGDIFSDIEGFWDEVERVICPGFPFDRNFDALSDAFVGGLCEKGIPYRELVEIIWKDSHKSRVALGYEETARYLEETRPCVHASGLQRRDDAIRAAWNHEGPTLFDDIVRLIEDHWHKLDLD